MENSGSSFEGVGGGFGGALEQEQDCYCLEDISEIEILVLETQGKTLMCDSTCVDGTDLIWGEIRLR